MPTEKLSLKGKRKADLEDFKASEEEISSKLKKHKSTASETPKVQNAKSGLSEAATVRILRSSSKTNNEKNDSSPSKNEGIIITRSSQKSETDSQISSPFQKMTRMSTKIQNPSSKSSTMKSDKPSSSSKVKDKMKKKLLKKKKKVAIVGEMKHFRSCFRPLLSFLNNHNSEISKEFDEEMMKTPFGPLYQVFRKNILKDKHLKKSNAAIVKILQQFSQNEKTFKFGKKSVQLTIEDVALVFGIPGAGKFVNFVDRNFQEKTEFVKRTWPDFGKDKHVSKTDVESALEKVLKGKKDTDPKDYVRLIVTYIMMTVFSPSSAARISWSFFPFVESVENLDKIDWASTIHNTLVNQLCKWTPAKPWTITGCSLLLLYFVCEHTTLIPEIEQNKGYFPRFAKWSTTELVKVLETRQLDTLQDDEVNVLLGNFKQEEADLLINKYENQFLDDIFEDVRETEINKLRVKIESLEKENLDLRKEVHTLREKLKDNDEGKNEDSVQKENSDLREEVENLKEKLGQNDEDKDEEMKNTEKQFQLLEYYCNETMSQFWESIENPVRNVRNEMSTAKDDEQQTNEVTKTEKKIEAKSSISMGVKLRKRGKANLIPEKKEIAVNKRRTRAETSARALEAIEVEKFIDVPDVQKLKCVTKTEAWKLLDDKQKPIVEYFFKNENRNTEVWKSTKSDVIIYGATLENLMFNEPLNNSVIDWYSYKLQEEQDSNSTKSYFFQHRHLQYYLMERRI